MEYINFVSLVNNFAEYFSRKNLEGISALLHENFILEDPVFKRLEGKDKMINILQEQFEKTKNVSYDIINLYQTNNTSIVEFKISFDELILNGVDFMEWENEKIKELRCYYNSPAI